MTSCQFIGVYLKNWTDNFFPIFFMRTSCVALSNKHIKTRASREMTSRKKKSEFSILMGVNVAKHWHVAGRGICHLWLPCLLWEAYKTNLKPYIYTLTHNYENIYIYIYAIYIYIYMLYIYICYAYMLYIYMIICYWNVRISRQMAGCQQQMN